MGEKRGMKALQTWCQRVTEGYKDVHIENMSSSWRDGLAFCAIIHHFRPELINFDSLSKENILENNEMAFSVAEKHLGIPALLEAEDMVKYKVPDKLSIMTYLSQFYQCFQGSGQAISPSKSTKRPLENSESNSSPSPDSPPGKVAAVNIPPPSLPQRHDVCQMCHHRVYILERLIIDSKLYHRMCFKCCRCQTVLKPGSYVEGRLPGQYECVSCPDEEEAETAAIASMAANRVAQLTSPSENWQPIRPRQPTYLSKMQLTSSLSEARRKFLQSDIDVEESKKTENEDVVCGKTNGEVGKGDASENNGEDHVECVKTEKCSNEEIGEVKEDLDMADDKDENVTPKPNSEGDVASDKEEANDDNTVEENKITHENKVTENTQVDSLVAPLAKPEDEEFTPVPSPRCRRKPKTSLDTSVVSETDGASDEVFITPSSSPLPVHRDSPRSNLSTDEDKLEASSAEVKVGEETAKPVVNVRLSRSHERRSGSTTPPSQMGIVVHDMPVIQPTVPPRILSPPRVKSSSKMDFKFNTLQPPPKPKRLSSNESLDDGKKDAVPTPRRRMSLEGKMTDAGGESKELKSPSVVLKSAKSDSPIKSDVCDSVSPKKVPPPRPQLPAFLKPSPKSKTDNEEKTKISYPDELNPFGDDDEETRKEEDKEKTKSLNPFDSDEDENEEQLSSNTVSESQLSQLTCGDTLSDISVTSRRKEPPPNSNPFGSDEDDEEEEENVELRTKTEDKSSLNVAVDYSTHNDKPTPLPRRSLDMRSTSVSPAGSVSKQTGLRYTGSYSANTSPAGSMSKASGSKYSSYYSPSRSETLFAKRGSRDSGLDISPTGSISRGYRKKRPAPKPPGDCLSADQSPRSSHVTSARSAKKSPAPPPPPHPHPSHLSLERRSTTHEVEITEKTMKELDNLTLKSSGSDTAGTDQLSSPSPGQIDENLRSDISKNTFGYWKKKKPAPPVPLPPKRQIVKLPLEEIQMELKKIEEKQLEMETQGVELEKAIRERCLDETDGNVDDDSDDLVLELFDLVNQKNVLFRRQAELIYLRRTQRLEEEHAELEFQIRCLMGKPETSKTDEDRELEEELIQRLMEVVSQRNEIIESMENDRLREKIEDQSIQQQMELRQASSSSSLEPQKKKEKKKKKDKEAKKVKSKEKEKSKAVDEDKDLDDVEAAKEKNKKDKKRKWF